METPSKTFPSAAKPSAALDLDQLQAAVTVAKERFARIREKYPQIKAYLVYCLPGKQTGITTSPQEILNNLPGMLIDDAAKAAVQAWMKKEPAKDAGKEAKEDWDEQLREFAAVLRYRSDYRVEIRFDHLDYELISQLQSDKLIDRTLTPQTRASIRIVLGTLSSFAA